MKLAILPRVAALALKHATKPSALSFYNRGLIKTLVCSSSYSLSAQSSQSHLQEIPSKCDVCIIGGGAMGSSTAFWLKQHPLGKHLKVVVIERDPKYTKASTVLSLGGIRYQFSNAENVQLSMFGMDFLNNINQYLNVKGETPVDINFTEGGYLILASTPEGTQTLHDNHVLQKQFNSIVELLSKEQLNRKFPELNTDDITCASYGVANEGWFDPWSLLNAFKKKALSLGAHYVTGEVVGFDNKNECDGRENSIGPKQLQVKGENGQVSSIEFDHCVIAAGYNSGSVSQLAGIGTGNGLLSTPLPVEPRKRYVYYLNVPELVGKQMPYFFDPTGVYARPEGKPGYFYTGRCPEKDEDEPSCENLDVDYNFFDTDIWPILAHRVPAMENLKIKSAWGGYYDFNTFDQNGIIGTHPSYKNFHFVTGFSGHGIQQAPAAGHAIMELILEGGFRKIDLNRLGFERVIRQEKLLEKNIF